MSDTIIQNLNGNLSFFEIGNEQQVIEDNKASDLASETNCSILDKALFKNKSRICQLEEYPSFNPNYRNKYEFSNSDPVSKILNECIKVEDQVEEKENLSQNKNNNSFNFFFEDSNKTELDEAKIKALNYLKMRQNQTSKGGKK